MRSPTKWMKSASIEPTINPLDIMTLIAAERTFTSSHHAVGSRLDYLDATRAFALLLGIVFHACLSFMPMFMGWAVQAVSTSPLVAMFMSVSLSFRMQTCFRLPGFVSHQTSP